MLLRKCLWGFVTTNKEGLLQANSINWVKLMDSWRMCCRSWLSTEAQQADPTLESEMKTVMHGLEVHSHSPEEICTWYIPVNIRYTEIIQTEGVCVYFNAAAISFKCTRNYRNKRKT